MPLRVTFAAFALASPATSDSVPFWPFQPVSEPPPASKSPFVRRFVPAAIADVASTAMQTVTAARIPRVRNVPVAARPSRRVGSARPEPSPRSPARDESRLG